MVMEVFWCKYDLFVLGWARVRRVRRENISSELLMCAQSFVITSQASLFYVCCNDYVGVCGNVCCVGTVVQDSVFLALEC